jgi:hypothetical protein
VTHVLLDSRFVSRRKDGLAVIAWALRLAAAEGLGCRSIADLVDRPVSTVRDWLRAARKIALRAARLFAAVLAWVAPDPAAVSPRPVAEPVAVFVQACSALAAGLACRWRRGRVGWLEAGAAVCRSRILQVSWWAGGAQREPALSPAGGPGPWWWRGD